MYEAEREGCLIPREVTTMIHFLLFSVIQFTSRRSEYDSSAKVL